MKTMTEKQYIGIDISKTKLDVCAPWWATTKTFKNSPKGLQKLFRAIKSKPISCHLVCEATGGYEGLLLLTAWKHDVTISRVNPRKVRHLAIAMGFLAKTDPIDAFVITEFGKMLKPKPTPEPTKTAQQLGVIVRRREFLMRQLTREKNAKEKASDTFILQDINASIASLSKRLAHFDEAIAKLIDADEVLREKRRRMEQVTGIGPGTSRLLLAALPELGSISDKEVSALVGLAPMNCDSGTRRGKRIIQGGRANVRRGLYMPALCAARHNPTLKAFYDRLCSAGKAHHVALTAVMRKLICLLNRILADPDFNPA